MLPWSTHDLPLEMAAEGMNILKRAAESGGLEELELFALAMVVLRTSATPAAVNGITVCAERPGG